MRRRTWLPVLALVTASTLGLAGCSSPTESDSDAPAESGVSEEITGSPEIIRDPDFEIPKVTGEWGQVPQISTVDAEPPTRIVSKLITPGDGAEVPAGGMVTIYYTGVLWDGKAFDSSFNHGEGPTTLDLNRVIDGWKYGLPGAKVGDRILLVVPPEYGYGATEQGSIPPNSTLIFVIDIADVPGSDLSALKEAQLTEEELPAGLLISGAPGEAPGIGFEEGSQAPTEQVEVTLAKGAGDPVTPGDSVAYHYTGAYWGTPNAAETTWESSPTVLPAQDTVFLGHNVGDRVLFVFPPQDESTPAQVIIVDIIGVY